jgi:hypothetical protein
MSFALFALTAGLALLFVALRQALRPHRKAVAVAVSVPSAETITAVPTSALAANIPAPAIRLIKRWGWAALDKLAALLEALEGDDEVPTPALLREKALQAQAAHQAQHGRRPSGGSRSTGGTWNLNGTSYRLPANTPPPNGSGKGTHKRTPSMHNNAPAPPNALLAISVPLSSPPVSPRNRGVFTPPPTMRQVQGMPVTGARPLSAARLIMSRHVSYSLVELARTVVDVR